jgi:outer membrane immunogenic protein
MKIRNVGFIFTAAAMVTSFAFADEAKCVNQPEELKYTTPSEETKCSTDTNDNWKGFYLGLNGGALFNVSKYFVKSSASEFFSTPVVMNKKSSHVDGTAFTGGIQLGYNYHFSYFFIGLETDFNYSSLSKTHKSTWGSATPTAGTVSYSIKDELNWFGTVRPRLGYVWDPVILYVTGGFSYGHIKSSATGSSSFGSKFKAGSLSETCIGWNVGAGLEWCFVAHWSLKLEYLFQDLQRKDYAKDSIGLKNRNHIARAGINYLF